jgi:hypothetical protein
MGAERGRWPAAHGPEERLLSGGAQAVPPARAAACAVPTDARPAVLAAARALWAGAATGHAALIPQLGASLGRRAQQGGRATDRAVRGGRTARYEDALAFQGRQTRRGPTTLTSRRWGASPHERRGGRDSLSTARQRRSGAQPCCFPAGQRDFDCVFLQKVELCDKNDRYESCR